MKLAAGGVLGDVDGNGQVDIFDALYVLLYSEDSSITLPNNSDISRGDVNGDGQVDLADAMLLIRYSSNPSDPALPSGIGQAAPDVVDVAVSKIYWAEEEEGIYRSNLGGTNRQPLVTEWGSVHDIALDVAGGTIYWTDVGSRGESGGGGQHLSVRPRRN